MSQKPGGVRILTPLPRILVDRADQRVWFCTRVAAAIQADELDVVVFTGMPGVGKTALALWCADQARKLCEFDVVLEIGIGAASRARSVEDVLTVFLPALGVSPLPTTRERMIAEYRAALVGLSVLVLLDDVENVAQINELLPVSARGVVIATSRRRYEEFEQHDYTTVPIDVFTPASAKELLVHGMDSAAAQAVDEQLDAVAELCGRLPLALGIARAHLRTRHRERIDEYVRQLRTAKNRMLEFKIDGNFLVKNIYEVTYQELSDDAKSLYRLLSLHPGNQFDEWVAVALRGPNYSGSVADDLHSLVVPSLLTDLGSARYELHTLIREHAAGLASDTDHAADQRQARRRMVLSYLQFVVVRELVLSPRRNRFGEQFDGRLAPAYTGEDAYERAIRDLELERANIRRIVRLAADEGFDDLCWQLGEASETFFFQRELHADGLDVQKAGLGAAQNIYDDTGDPRPLFRMHMALGASYFAVENDDAAGTHFGRAERRALELTGEDRIVGLAKVYVWQAFVHQRRGEFAMAVAAVDKSSQLVVDAGFPARLREREVALLDMNSGPMLARIGRHDEAIAAGRRALAYLAVDSEKHNHAKSVANLGTSLSLSGARYQDEAIALLTEAIALTAGLNMVLWEADSSEILGDLLRGIGRKEEGDALLHRAVALFDKIGSRRAQQLRARLDPDR